MNEQHKTSISFFNYAHSYASSARALRGADVDATHPDGPVYFLYFHAIELYLKSYLMAFGFTEGQLRKRKYGHNICCLANEAEGHGLTLADTDRHVVLHLSESDNIMTSRYIKLGVHSRLPFDVLHETCYRLHAEIGPKAYEGSGVTRRPVLPPGPVNMLKSIESRLNARD